MIITMEHPDMYEKLVDSVEAHGGVEGTAAASNTPQKKNR